MPEDPLAFPQGRRPRAADRPDLDTRPRFVLAPQREHRWTREDGMKMVRYYFDVATPIRPGAGGNTLSRANDAGQDITIQLRSEDIELGFGIIVPGVDTVVPKK